jgi:hypothetical protein
MTSALLALALVSSVALPVASGGAPSGVSIADVRVVEGDERERLAEVTIRMAPAASAPVTVRYGTADGTATAGTDYRAANGTVIFSPGDVVKRVTIEITGDTAAEPDETFTVALTDVSGATVVNRTASITIVSDDFTSPGLPVYEVRLTYTGHTGSMAGAEGCPVRPNGKVVLTGLLSGKENVSADDDIEYTGVLWLDVDIDLCEASGPDGATRLCGMTLIAAGGITTELSLRTDSRGGYVKVSKAPGHLVSLPIIFGTCDAELVNEEMSAFPYRSGATMFNGLELPLALRTLRVGRYAEDGIVVEVLRVVRR